MEVSGWLEKYIGCVVWFGTGEDKKQVDAVGTVQPGLLRQRGCLACSGLHGPGLADQSLGCFREEWAHLSSRGREAGAELFRS